MELDLENRQAYRKCCSFALFAYYLQSAAMPFCDNIITQMHRHRRLCYFCQTVTVRNVYALFSDLCSRKKTNVKKIKNTQSFIP